MNFPFVPNGKFIIFKCPKIWAHYSLTMMCLNIGTPNNYHFPFETNGKVVVLGVPILKHFRDITLFHLNTFCMLQLRNRFLLTVICFPIYHWLEVSREVNISQAPSVGDISTDN